MNDNTKTIFIVDDNIKNIQIAANFLRMANYKVLFADNGNEALKNIEKYMPNMVLLDIMMPGMDGFEVCSKLKENKTTKDIPVIFLTAKTEAETIEQGFKIGGVDYIIKPFNRQELIARINTHITLQSQQNELLQINKTKDKLFSVMGHDLRGNISTIVSMSELLLDKNYNKTEEQIDQFHRYINNQAKTLNIILNNLLDWSRLNDDRIIYDPGKINIKKSIDENVKHLIEDATLKNIIIESALKADLFGYADRNMLHTVLRNLIFNAIKFTNIGGIIKVNAEKQGNEIIISVADSGVGIRKEKQDMLFNNETIISTRGTAEETGTGLGLYLCKQFIEQNHGKLWLKSEPQKGSVFYFSIPVFQ